MARPPYGDSYLSGSVWGWERVPGARWDARGWMACVWMSKDKLAAAALLGADDALGFAALGFTKKDNWTYIGDHTVYDELLACGATRRLCRRHEPWSNAPPVLMSEQYRKLRREGVYYRLHPEAAPRIREGLYGSDFSWLALAAPTPRAAASFARARLRAVLEVDIPSAPPVRSSGRRGGSHGAPMPRVRGAVRGVCVRRTRVGRDTPM